MSEKDEIETVIERAEQQGAGWLNEADVAVLAAAARRCTEAERRVGELEASSDLQAIAIYDLTIHLREARELAWKQADHTAEANLWLRHWRKKCEVMIEVACKAEADLAKAEAVIERLRDERIVKHVARYHVDGSEDAIIEYQSSVIHGAVLGGDDDGD